MGVQNLGDLVWKCNLHHKDAKARYGNDDYWAQTLSAWCEINYFVPVGKAEIQDQIIWFNSHVRVNNKPIYWNMWILNGILLVEDLFEGDRNPKKWDRFLEEFPNLKGNWLEWASLMSLIPNSWKVALKNDIGEEKHQYLYEELDKCAKISRKVTDI